MILWISILMIAMFASGGLAEGWNASLRNTSTTKIVAIFNILCINLKVDFIQWIVEFSNSYYEFYYLIVCFTDYFTISIEHLSKNGRKLDVFFLHFPFELTGASGQSQRHLSARKSSPAGHFDVNLPAKASEWLMAYWFLLKGLAS